MDGLPALPTWPSHLILNRLSLRATPHLRAFPSLTVSMMTISAIRPPNSGASDYISGNKDLFSSISTTSALPTVTLANGSQTVAKALVWHILSLLYLSLLSFILLSVPLILSPSAKSLVFLTVLLLFLINCDLARPEYGEDDWHRTRLGHPSSSQVPKNGPSFFIFVVACVDNAGEYFSAPFTSFISQHGILHQSSCAHTPQQNGNMTNFLQKPQNASSWDTLDFKRVIVVIPLRLIATFSPLMSPSLRTHHSSAPLSLFLFLKSYPSHYLFTRCSAFSPTSGLSSSSSCRCSSFFSRGNLLTHFLSLRLLLPRLCLLLLTYPLLFGKDLVVLPSDKSTVGCRWVYTVKVGPNGQVDRLKARLVAKGYTQVYGSDYGDTFSPVVKIVSVRLLLFMAAMRSWPLIRESGLVCRLRRSLYGLKQSPRAWFSRFSSVVQEFDMFHSITDHSVSIIITLRAVYLSGIEIAQSSFGVVLSQRKYALDILEETGMLDCKPVDTPMDPNVKLILGQEEPLGDPRRYRRLVAHQAKVCCTKNKGHTQVVGYTDADWTGSPTDRCSTSGAEAEYRAMALTTCELIWLKHLLRELRFGKMNR
ncbi:Retrovirus-related Pol polyprotein from transposon RE1 [Vitis vinifera]|uniref:Retrovirus-related Pol polyprotein from transposon RE1 n=1 Tax=Vitis vinifera TaxID=29760 RepID=A0A438C308_VITVI|nr:Retrovirus-related Pol polyprotein from transposon RE1 [Vitis vinifera]